MTFIRVKDIGRNSVKLNSGDASAPLDRINFEFFEFEASDTTFVEVDANTKDFAINGFNFFDAQPGDLLLALVQFRYINAQPVTTFDFSFDANNFTDWVQIGNTKDQLAREPPIGGGTGDFRGAQFFSRVWQSGDELRQAGFRILTDLGITGGNFDATVRIWTIRGADPSRIEIASSLVNVDTDPDIVWPAVSRSWVTGTFDVRYYTSENAGNPDIPGYTGTGASSGLDADSDLQFREEPNPANPIASVSVASSPNEYLAITLAIGATDTAVNDALNATASGIGSGGPVGDSRVFNELTRRAASWSAAVPSASSRAEISFGCSTAAVAPSSGVGVFEVFTRVLKAAQTPGGTSGFLSSWVSQGTYSLTAVAGQVAIERALIGPFGVDGTLFQQASDLTSESLSEGDILMVAILRDPDVAGDTYQDDIFAFDVQVVWS